MTAITFPLEYLNEHTGEWCSLRIEDIKAVFNERKYILRDAAPAASTAVTTGSAPVNFIGMNPLEIGKGASLPMIPDSWRYGFRKTAVGFDFCAQDDGPLVAWDAVKDAVAASPAASVLIAWREMDEGDWIYYDIHSSTGKHITEYQKFRHGISVFPVYGACDPSADTVLEKAIDEFNRTLLLASLGGDRS